MAVRFRAPAGTHFVAEYARVRDTDLARHAALGSLADRRVARDVRNTGRCARRRRSSGTYRDRADCQSASGRFLQQVDNGQFPSIGSWSAK